MASFVPFLSMDMCGIFDFLGILILGILILGPWFRQVCLHLALCQGPGCPPEVLEKAAGRRHSAFTLSSPFLGTHK